jgi:hypothetical protein
MTRTAILSIPIAVVRSIPIFAIGAIPFAILLAIAAVGDDILDLRFPTVQTYRRRIDETKLALDSVNDKLRTNEQRSDALLRGTGAIADAPETWRQLLDARAQLMAEQRRLAARLDALEPKMGVDVAARNHAREEGALATGLISIQDIRMLTSSTIADGNQLALLSVAFSKDPEFVVTLSRAIAESATDRIKKDYLARLAPEIDKADPPESQNRTDSLDDQEARACAEVLARIADPKIFSDAVLSFGQAQLDAILLASRGRRLAQFGSRFMEDRPRETIFVTAGLLYSRILKSSSDARVTDEAKVAVDRAAGRALAKTKTKIGV